MTRNVTSRRTTHVDDPDRRSSVYTRVTCLVLSLFVTEEVQCHVSFIDIIDRRISVSSSGTCLAVVLTTCQKMPSNGDVTDLRHTTMSPTSHTVTSGVDRLLFKPI